MLPLAALAAASIAQASASISDVYQRNFQDASFTARVVTGNQAELQKINKDFGASYRFKFTHVKIKEPFKLRLESEVDDTQAVMVLNGPTQLLRVPRIRFSQKTNLADEAGRRQTLLDFGVLTPSLFEDLFQAKFVRVDRATNDLVFDITFHPKYDNTTRHRVWIDREKRVVSKREWYNQHGRQLATFFYENPKQIAGVWFPTQVTVRNMENKVAGVTEYTNLKVNSGLSEDLFKVN
ncbi:MAG TPA: outer membrane lipoprotein-sorting protein [Fimbriimonadaceae bacterium]|nr:outer membrane lipoprotein-sorting protein [Fimbriimonadaceae bacterium]